MTTTLYFAPISTPARSCLLLARYLKLDITVKTIDLAAGEQHSEEFLKLNPLHKLPVLVDGDYVLAESRAIMAYLINSRKPGHSLYPSDPKKRGIVDQRLYYDATNVFPKLSDILVSSAKRKLIACSHSSLAATNHL